MKKVLLAFDDDHFSEGAFEMAHRLNEIQPILLVGVFLPAVYYAIPAVTEAAQPFFVPLTEDEDVEIIENNIRLFENKCSENNIKYFIHKNLGDAVIPSIKTETRFTDLLIIGSQAFYKNIGSAKPNEYLKNVLHEAECPVLVVPEKFDFPTSVIFAYNGEESSMYAIKQFSYLLPQLCKQKALVVYASHKSAAEIPDLSYIEEYAHLCFENLEIRKIDFDTRKFFAAWIRERTDAILVTGAYGRTDISEMFRQSFVSEVISQHNIPVFIAHR